MDETEILRRYAARSESAAHANVDVTARVLTTIERQRKDRQTDSLRPLLAVAAASWLLALLTGILVHEAWSDMQDPLTSLLSPFVISLQ